MHNKADETPNRRRSRPWSPGDSPRQFAHQSAELATTRRGRLRAAARASQNGPTPLNSASAGTTSGFSLEHVRASKTSSSTCSSGSASTHHAPVARRSNGVLKRTHSRRIASCATRRPAGSAPGASSAATSALPSKRREIGGAHGEIMGRSRGARGKSHLPSKRRAARRGRVPRGEPAR